MTNSNSYSGKKTIGRIPPHNDDAETALLGAVLLRNKALDDIQGLISEEDFYQKCHQLIWKAINGLHSEKPGVTIDLVSLSQYMRTTGILAEAGGASYISSLTETVPSSTNAAYYAEIIKNTSIKRKLLNLSIEMGDKALDETEDVHHTMDELEQKFSRIDINSGISTCIESGNLISKVMDNMLAIERGDKSIGLSSGFRSLDRCIGGFKPSELIIIAARPSVGKTAFALSIAANMAYGDNPVPIGFFSLEMSGASLMERILASKSRINMMKIRNGVMDFETKNRLMDTASFLYDYSKYLIVQDTPNIKLPEIRSQARLLVRQYHVKAIFIDYIGLVDLNPSNANMPRHEQVSQISRSLKQLARELEIPVICLCQVNRDAGKERPPMLADLRDSGSIEQDADLVLLMDDQSKRLDDKGKIAQYEEELEYSENKSKLLVRPIKIIIAKQRNGNTGAFRLNFVSDYVSFNEIEAF